ncbi:YjjG family noncanonical pyrimidine nucleotidase [Deminuibacter soli]|uniref:Noncanonical pyrimidine nucleotidase, YjjG family n=1 Tax=Deminuibacter soli TaxID=2291815 RepID=A0A3E1NRH4_9BACT|nr:YjjG family noncanonical pyrimidine nucleotidase [Deminuibacter soli]RFM30497.1 noncanonical pyrimidine nucleotidase, YjjG family [Deminuibacter soli]
MKYKHLFFDLDHTLWDFETNARETLSTLYQQHALAERGVHDFELFFERYNFHNNRLWDRYTKGYIKQDELRWKRQWLTLLDFKIADEPLARELSARFLDHLPYRKNLFPYTMEILQYLQQKGYALHLVTNGFDSVQHCKLEHSGIKSFFGEVVTSEKSNSLKPNKEIFDYAMALTGATAATSIMIGDNLDADIQGGINAGMDTIFVNHLGIDPHVQATYVVHDLKALENIL